jgi:hypothetical protein
MEVYGPTKYLIESVGFPFNYTLTRNPLFGSTEKSSGSFNENNTLLLKEFSYYTLIISSHNNDLINIVPKGARDAYLYSYFYNSTFNIYILTTLLGILTSFSRLNMYMQSSNSVVSLYYICFWIDKFINEIDKEKLNFENSKGFINRLKPYLIHQKYHGFNEEQISEFPFLNLSKAVDEIVEKSLDSDCNYDKIALMAIAVDKLSYKGENSEKNFKPSFSYYLLELYLRQIINIYYIPNSKKLLENYIKDKNMNNGINSNIIYSRIKDIESKTTRRKSSIGVLIINGLKAVIERLIKVINIKIISGALAVLVSCIVIITQVPLLIKLVGVLYLSLNITMYLCLNYRIIGKPI